VRDVNAKPKMFTRRVYEQLELTSDDWFIDAEIMIKARRFVWKVAEVPTVFYKNLQRQSYVRFGAVFEFIKNLAGARLQEFAWQLRRQKFSTSVLVPLAAGLALRLAVFIPWYVKVGAQQWLASASFTQPFFTHWGHIWPALELFHCRRQRRLFPTLSMFLCIPHSLPQFLSLQAPLRCWCLCTL
jgi:hypothetical protein